MTMELVLKTVRSFVADRGGDGGAILPATRLLGEGHVDSFALIELIAALEKALGLDLAGGALIPEDFETVERLFERLTVLAE